MKTYTQGIIFDIQNFSVQDGPGIRKTIFLKGCPLSCTWCHNPEGLNFGLERWEREQKTGNSVVKKYDIIGEYVTPEQIMEELVKDIPFFDESGGGVTLSGGEPLSQPDFSYELLKKSKENSIHTCIDTTGYAPWELFDKMLKVTDLFLYDLKIASPEEHMKHTGKDNKLIIENLYNLDKVGKETIIRIPLIKDITDTADNLEGLKNILANLENLKRIDLLPFHNIATKKYKSLGKKYIFEKTPKYPEEKAQEIRQQFLPYAEVVTIGGSK